MAASVLEGVGEKVCSCKGGDEIGGVLNLVTSGVKFECLAIGDAIGDGGDDAMGCAMFELDCVGRSFLSKLEVD